MNLASMNFDRWRIELFRKACTEEGFAIDPTIRWNAVGQGSGHHPGSRSSRNSRRRRSRTEGTRYHSLASANAVVVMDPAKNKEVGEAKSSARIDPLVAALSCRYIWTRRPPPDEENFTRRSITDNSFSSSEDGNGRLGFTPTRLPLVIYPNSADGNHRVSFLPPHLTKEGTFMESHQEGPPFRRGHGLRQRQNHWRGVRLRRRFVPLSGRVPDGR